MYYQVFFIAIIASLLIAGFYMLVSFFYKKHSIKKVNKALHIIRSSSQYQKTKHQKRPEDPDFLLRDEKVEKIAKEESQYDVVSKYNPQEKDISLEPKEKIVGIAEPKGFWSKFIASQKFGYILARMSMQQSSQSGFWVNLIKAQSMSRGKDQGKGR